MSGVEAVRKRPGMYIGDVRDGSGLHEMLFELLKNALTEAFAGHCDRVDVRLNANGSVTVRDNGRGIPTEMWRGESVPEVIMTRLHVGGTIDKPVELQGVSVAAVNALSEALELRIWREGKEYYIRFRRGHPEAPLAVIGQTSPSADQQRGTEITFLPDTRNIP